VRWGFLMVIL